MKESSVNENSDFKSDSYFSSMPKVDLHLHIDGALRTQTILDLAKIKNHPLPATTAPELDRYVKVSPDCRSLTDFLATFHVFYDLLKDPAALERVTEELCEDLIQDNVMYAELRFAPVLNIVDPEKNPSNMKIMIEAAARGLEKGRKKGLEGGLIVCCYRGFPVEAAVQTVQFAHEVNQEAIAAGRSRPVYGIDLAGDESRFEARPFSEAFRLARELGFPITVHAAEASGSISAKDALEFLHADRIGHGVRIREDAQLMEIVREKKIPLEMCLTSNLQTGTVKSLSAHPFAQYLRNGISVTINTDDPGISGINLSHEWKIASECFSLTAEEQKKILMNSIQAAFAPDDVKKRIAERAAAFFDRERR